MVMAETPAFLTIAQAAERLRVNQMTVRRWLANGLIHGVQPAGPKGRWLIPEDELWRLARRGAGGRDDDA